MKDDEIKWNMHFGADPVIFERAEELRARMTPAEEILWNAIKINEWHLKFRRQHPVFKYIADLYCHSVKLVIELDGGYHENREIKIYDNARENEIKQFGITVLRYYPALHHNHQKNSNSSHKQNQHFSKLPVDRK